MNAQFNYLLGLFVIPGGLRAEIELVMVECNIHFNCSYNHPSVAVVVSLALSGVLGIHGPTLLQDSPYILISFVFHGVFALKG